MILTRQIAAAPRAGALALLALVCSCNRESRLEGRYSAQNGSMFDLEFKDGHKANMISGFGGVTMEFDYEVNGKEVKLKFPQGTMIATIADDGCLNLGNSEARLCKQKVASSGFLKRAISREPRLEGRYTSPQGLFDLEFKDGNKVNQITLFGTTEIDYELSGREVKLKAPTGTMVGTIGDDGCLNFGGIYGAMCKRKITSSDSSSAGPQVPAVAITAPLGAQGYSHTSSVMPAGYLQEMPTADRVLADFTGPDSVDTRARRYTAVGLLRDALHVLTKDHEFTPGLSQEEARLFQGYVAAESQLRTGSANVPGLTARIDSLCCGKPAQVILRRQLLERYFTPAWQKAFLAREEAVGERQEARR